MNKKAVMIIANVLHYQFKVDRSTALKQAWAMVKGGFKTNISGVTFGRRQLLLSNLNASSAGAYIMKEKNRYNTNSIIVVVNGVKFGYLKDKATSIVNALLKKGIRVITQVLVVVGGNGYKYGLTVGLKIAA